MAERSPADVAQADPGAPSDRTAAALAPLRERIDAIDHEIVALLNERAQIALEIGRVKEQTGRRTVRDAQREAEVLERVTSASAGLFPEPELVALYRKLIAATRRVQHAQKRQAAAGAGSPALATMESAGPTDAADTSPGRREE
jgi:chorismate mutase/prephenate dehydratase